MNTDCDIIKCTMEHLYLSQTSLITETNIIINSNEGQNGYRKTQQQWTRV